MTTTLTDYLAAQETTVSYDGTALSQRQAMIDHGLDPDLWQPVRSTIDALKGMVRLTVKYAPLRPARLNKPAFKVPEKHTESQVAKTVVFMSDQHWPNHDEELHQAACEFIYRNKPDLVIAGGDGANFPSLSRFDPDPRFDTHAQLSIDGYYSGLRDYGQAAKRSKGQPPVVKKLLEGNHDKRLWKHIIRYSFDLYKLRRAGDTDPAHSLPFLLRLDELGWEWREDVGYPEGRYEIAPGFWAMHGVYVSKTSGGSVLRALDHFGFSVMMGHIHRAATVYHSRPGIAENLVGVEAACMCGPQGYEIDPNWQKGFVAVKVYEDGFPVPTNVLWVDKRLRYTGWR